MTSATIAPTGVTARLFSTKTCYRSITYCAFFFFMWCVSGPFLQAELPKQHWSKTPKVATYDTALNTTFIKIRTNPSRDTLMTICGENGLCHERGACQHRASLSFFWLLCKEIVPAFAKLPCVKDNAEQLSFDAKAGVFVLEKNYAPLEYLEAYLFSPQTPRYLQFITAKIITQLPQNLIPLSTQLHNQSCSQYRKMCLTPPMPPLDEGPEIS
ncbi:hypothetical protein [Candidatus Hepatobacter penaei]|uniref:hypothetical protein n=1 Tax=Candidatus Hepatobacter penaei TaxID=1274402 RepID=UPI0010940315|nr:hypothetical protein [Candidatus Hepatobacter penaei]TGW15875.1 hypothetical protein EIL50_00700 [bacterium NHP-B]